MTTVYKVVSVVAGEQLRSFNWPRLYYSTCVEYKVGERTLPKISCAPLMAFKDIESAKDFALGCGAGGSRGRIYKAEAVVSEQTLPKGIDPAITGLDDLQSFWADPDDFLKNNPGWDPVPSGTILCNSITLLEQVSCD